MPKIFHTPASSRGKGSRRGRPRRINTSAPDDGSGDHADEVNLDSSGGESPRGREEGREPNNREPADSEAIMAGTSDNNGADNEQDRQELTRPASVTARTPNGNGSQAKQRNPLSIDNVMDLLIRLDEKMDQIKTDALEPLKRQVSNIEEVVDKNFDTAFNQIRGLGHKITEMENGLLHEQQAREELHARITREFTDEHTWMNATANELRGELREMRNNAQNNPRRVQGNEDSKNPFGKIPKIEITGTESNPMEMLAEVDRRLSICREQDKLRWAEKILQGAAKEWYGVERSNIQTWEEFKLRFKQTYWNRYVQQGVRDIIETGKYEEESAKGSRLEYAYELLAKAQHLEPRVQEELLVNKLCTHFGDRFYNCSINQGTETVTQLIHLIQRLEAKGIWKNQKCSNGKPYVKDRNRYRLGSKDIRVIEKGVTTEKKPWENKDRQKTKWSKKIEGTKKVNAVTKEDAEKEEETESDAESESSVEDLGNSLGLE